MSEETKRDPQTRDTPTPGIQGGASSIARSLPAQKPKNFRGTFARLLRYIRPYSGILILTLLISVAGTLFTIFSPKILGQATTIFFNFVLDKLKGINAPMDFSRIAQILLLLAALYLISAGFSYLQSFIMVRVSQKIVFDMRNDIRSKISRLPLQYFDTHRYGDVLSRVANDMDTVGSTLQQSINQFIASIVLIVGVVVLMLTISPWLTLITMVTLPLTFVITKKVAKRSQKIFARQQHEIGILNSHVEEMFGGHVIVKSFGNEKKAVGRFRDINERLYEVGWRSQIMAGLVMPLIGFLSNIGYVLICVVGTIFVVSGRITIGNVQAFIQYSRQFTQPILQTANIANTIQAAIASAERVFELLDEAEESPDDPGALAEFKPRGGVRLEHISFSYRKDTPLITDLSLDVKPGQTAAIVGPTGAGKTTLVNLLMRFYEIGGGKITIDGMDIRDIQRGTVRGIFGMVLQDTWLFKGTIRENIAYGREDATEDQIINAAMMAYADHFIRTLPDGYDTMLNEDVSNISQGQKQLLTIARAFIANPAILILDEATSNVDTRTELLIQKAMKELVKGRTSFVIAHRLSTIQDADLIIVMNTGDVVETGTHEELLKMGGFYRSLYDSQFSTEDAVAAGA